MIMIEIAPLSNGAHRNQTANEEIPNGWAVIPDDMETENFPFGDIETKKISGVVTVTKWTALPIPAPPTVPNSEKRRAAYSEGIVDGVSYKVQWKDSDYTTDELTQLGLRYSFRKETDVAGEIETIVENGIAAIRAAFPDENEED